MDDLKYLNFYEKLEELGAYDFYSNYFDSEPTIFDELEKTISDIKITIYEIESYKDDILYSDDLGDIKFYKSNLEKQKVKLEFLKKRYHELEKEIPEFVDNFMQL